MVYLSTADGNGPEVNMKNAMSLGYEDSFPSSDTRPRFPSGSRGYLLF